MLGGLDWHIRTLNCFMLLDQYSNFMEGTFIFHMKYILTYYILYNVTYFVLILFIQCALWSYKYALCCGA